MAKLNTLDSVAAFVADRQNILEEVFQDEPECLVGSSSMPVGEQARILLRHEIASLLARAGQERPPVNLYRIASYCSIRRIIPKQTGVEGRIVRHGDSYDIEFDPRAPRGRRRFSLAHELAHTFFLKYVPTLTQSRARGASPTTGSSASRAFWRAEEDLCNFGAAELLMPAGPFLKETLELGPSILAARHLAQRWDVSLECCCRRIVELQSWPVAFLWTEFRDGCLVLCRSTGLPQDAAVSARSLSRRSPLVQIIESRARWNGELSLSLTGVGTRFFCDLHVLSERRNTLLMLSQEPEAEARHKLSQLRTWSLASQRQRMK